MITDKKDANAPDKKAEKRRVGRPTKWTDDMPGDLESLMAEGISFEACCGELGITKETGYQWIKDKPEFAAAKKMGEVKGQAFWEREMMRGLWSSKDMKFNTTAFIFIMKNRFGWRDRKEISGDINIGAKPLADVYKNWSDTQVDNEIELLMGRLMPKSKGPTRI